MQPAVVYAEELDRLGYGRPIWMPEHPTEASIELGDVGFIETRSGSFTRLFNVTRPPEDPLNQRGLPEGFAPLDISHISRADHPWYLSNGPIVSKSVKMGSIQPSATASAGVASASISYTFQCSQNRGALLFLQDHADRLYLHPNTTIPRYIMTHYQSWCDFAKAQDIELGKELEGPILVRGWIKTAGWAVAVMMAQSRSHELTVSGGMEGIATANLGFSFSDIALSGTHRRTGPHRNSAPPPPTAVTQESEEPPHVASSTVLYDQCVFLSYYKVKRRTLLGPKLIQAGAKPQDLPGSEPPGSASQIATVEEYQDPLDEVLDYILQDPWVDLAIACDGDISLLCLGQRWPSDFASALRRLSPSISALGNGKLFLRRTTTPIYLSPADIAGILSVVGLFEVSPSTQTFETGKSGSVDPRDTLVAPATPTDRGIVSSYARLPISGSTSGTSTRSTTVDVNSPEDTGVLIVELMESILGRNARSRSMVPEGESSYKTQESRQHSDFIFVLLRSAFLNGEFSAISELEGQNAVEALDIMYHVLRSEILSMLQYPLNKAKTLLRGQYVGLWTSSAMIPGTMHLMEVVPISESSISRGRYTDTYHGVFQERQVALKRLRSSHPESEFRRDALIWGTLDHPYILPLLGIAHQVGKEEVLALVSPWMKNGNVMQYMRTLEASGQTSFVGQQFRTTVNKWITQTAIGMAYLHSEGIVHGDLRLENILIDDEDNVRLIGFGRPPPSKPEVSEGGMYRREKPTASRSSDADKPTGKPGDIYTFGYSCVQLYNRGSTSQYRAPRPGEDMSVELRSLISSCCDEDSQPPDFDQIVLTLMSINQEVS